MLGINISVSLNGPAINTQQQTEPVINRSEVEKRINLNKNKKCNSKKRAFRLGKTIQLKININTVLFILLYLHQTLLLLEKGCKSYNFQNQGEVDIDGVDDNEEFKLTDVKNSNF